MSLRAIRLLLDRVLKVMRAVTVEGCQDICNVTARDLLMVGVERSSCLIHVNRSATHLHSYASAITR